MEIPERPDEADCCNSGCNPCIFDIYEKRLKEYEDFKSKKNINSSSKRNILKLTKYTNFKLIAIESITSNVNLYTFEYPDKNDDTVLKFLPGQYFILKGVCNNDENKFSRPYTPVICTSKNLKCIKNVTTSNQLFFQVAVKLEPNGLMSKMYKNLKLGDITMWRGPYGDFDYTKMVLQCKFSNLVCFSQGIGIAPIFCVIDSILSDETDETIIVLNCCFTDTKSIIFRREIQNFNQFWNFKSSIYLAHEGKCNCTELCNCIHYGETIYKHKMEINDVKKVLAHRNISEVYALICGNEKFCEEVENILLNLEFNKSNIYIF